MPGTPFSGAGGTRPRTRPMIYVASLADYNNGRLHGVWIYADADPSEIREAIRLMLAASPEPDAHDWAIHDHEGFGPSSTDEVADASQVDEAARLASSTGQDVIRALRRSET